MIIFSKVRMQNFFSVGNSPIEIDLNKYKKTLVVGKNGEGKSVAILDSICYALYGKPFKKVNKPNLINSKNKANLLVEIDFSIGSREYKVRRGMKPNVFEIYCNGVLVNQDASSKDYQNYLENYILKVNYKSFINVVILGSARYNPFMQMSSADRRTIIEELLDIQIFSTMNVLVKDKLSKLKEELSNTDYNIDITKEKVKLQEQNLEEHRKNKKQQIIKKREEIKKSNEQIQKLENDVSLIQKHIEVLQKTITDKSKIESKKQKLISIESKIETNVNKLKKELLFYTENDNCPTCKQSIQESFKLEQVNLNEKSQIKLREGLEKLEEEMVAANKRLQEILSVNKHIQDHHSEIIRINSSISAIQTYIQKELREIELYSKDSEVTINDNSLLSLQEELKTFEEKKSSLTEEKKYYDFSALLLKDGGIKTKIIKQYLPVMNKLINTYLSKMNFYVNFNINENFEEVIKSRYRDEFQYMNFSEGEKLRIDLSVLFTFRQIAKMKNSVSTNLLIMDEVMDSSLDLNGIDQFMDLIESLDTNTNVIIISHKGDALGDKFDRTLRFEKKKDFTKLTELR